MILRLDRWGTELPPPSEPDPAGAQAVQELMGGRFGEMSTLMNYLHQSAAFKEKERLKPFHEIVSSAAGLTRRGQLVRVGRGGRGGGRWWGG